MVYLPNQEFFQPSNKFNTHPNRNVFFLWFQSRFFTTLPIIRIEMVFSFHNSIFHNSVCCNFFMNGQCLAAICLIGRSFAPKPRKPANSFTKRRLQTWQPFDGKNRRRDVLRPVYKTQVRVAEDGLNLKQSIVT